MTTYNFPGEDDYAEHDEANIIASVFMPAKDGSDRVNELHIINDDEALIDDEGRMAYGIFATWYNGVHGGGWHVVSLESWLLTESAKYVTYEKPRKLIDVLHYPKEQYGDWLFSHKHDESPEDWEDDVAQDWLELAGNPDTSPTLLDRLAAGEDCEWVFGEEVVELVAGNTSTTSSTLARLVEVAYDDIVTIVASNPSISTNTLVELLRHEDEDVRDAARDQFELRA